MSSAILQSSSTLGTGKLSTFEERQEKAEDALVRKSLAGQAGKRKRHQDVYTVEDVSSDDGDNDKDIRPKKQTRLDVEGIEDNSSNDIMVVDAPLNPPPKKASESSVGSALHRNADGSIAMPKVRPPKAGKMVCSIPTAI